MDDRRTDRSALGMFVSSMLIFGTIGVFRRMIPLPSAFLAFVRGITGGLFLLAVGKIRKKQNKNSMPRKDGAIHQTAGEALTGTFIVNGLSGRNLIHLILTGVMIGINWMLLFEAYNYTTVAVATLCYYMQPTIVMLLSPFLFRERLTWKKGVCVALSFAGMALVSGAGGGAELGDFRGMLLGLGSAAFYAGVIIMNKKCPPVEARTKTTIQLLAAGATMIPYLLVSGGFNGLTFSAQVILLLLTVGVVHTGLAYLLYFRSMTGLKIQTIALFSYIDPVSALFFSALLLGEPLSLTGILGAILIIGSAAAGELLQ